MNKKQLIKKGDKIHALLYLFISGLFCASLSALPPYLVNTTADSGSGSLRDAITQVNLGTTDTIYFATLSGPIIPATDYPTIKNPVLSMVFLAVREVQLLIATRSPQGIMLL